MARTPKAPTLSPQAARDLRQWCIEQARGWPTYTVSGGYGGGMSSGYSVTETKEHDLIARADKILAWVLK